MHTGAPAADKKRVAKSRELGDDGLPAYCACGCGARLYRNSARRMPTYLHGHSSRKSQSDWEDSYRQYVAAAPLCQCGCGERVSLKQATLDLFIKSEGQRGHNRYIIGHSGRKFDPSCSLDDRQSRLLVAATYGDGSIGLPNSRSKHIRLVIRHSIKQSEWLQYKAAQFDQLCFQIAVTPNGGYGDSIISAVSKCMPQLDYLSGLCLRDGRKSFTEDGLRMLDDECVAWMFCDDGSSSGMAGRMHIEGYSPESQELFHQWFLGLYGDCRLLSYRGYRCLQINQDAYRAMCERVRQYIPAAMQYKMGAYRLDQ